MEKCKNCGVELEENVKFCSNCGEKVESDEVKDIDNGDISKKYILLSIVIGLIPALLKMKKEVHLDDASFFDFLSVFIQNASLPMYGELVGASIGISLTFPSMIVLVIWGIKKITKKRYEKPILHIFIGSLICSGLMIFGY